MRYRSEAFSGSGERLAPAVMAFETFELGNADILAYLFEGVLCEHAILAEGEPILQGLDENAGVYNIPEEDQRAFMQRLLDAVKERTGTDVVYGLWLADRANAYRYAMSADDISNMCNQLTEDDIPLDFEGLDAYDVSGAIILSDLGSDGTLYGFSTLPEPISSKTV